MERVQVTLVLNLFFVAVCVLGDAVAVFPPEARVTNQFQYFNPLHQFQPMYRNAVPQGIFMIDEPAIPQGSMEHHELTQPILHTAVGNPPPVPKKPMEGLNFTGHEMSRSIEEDEHRGAKGTYDYPSHGPSSYPTALSYGYRPPASPATYHPSSTSHYSPPATPTSPIYTPVATHHSESNKFFKSDLSSLIKPVSVKAASKVSGLLSLVFSLFSGAGDDLGLKGFKDILINGIVKPLLLAKGGIKTLISKLTIPVIALLLINLEVLITVWWLWEDCEESKPTYDYGKPTNTNKPYAANSYAPSSYAPSTYPQNSYN